jgi:hypothetical protein
MVRIKFTSKNAQSHTILPGDVFFVKNLEFENKTGFKGRPVVIVGIKDDKIEYRRCTTKNHEYTNMARIMDIISAGLIGETYVDGRIGTISRGKLSYRMGVLSKFDQEVILNK